MVMGWSYTAFDDCHILITALYEKILNGKRQGSKVVRRVRIRWSDMLPDQCNVYLVRIGLERPSDISDVMLAFAIAPGFTLVTDTGSTKGMRWVTAHYDSTEVRLDTMRLYERFMTLP